MECNFFNTFDEAMAFQKVNGGLLLYTYEPDYYGKDLFYRMALAGGFTRSFVEKKQFCIIRNI